jgi:hypothetical protein
MIFLLKIPTLFACLSEKSVHDLFNSKSTLKRNGCYYVTINAPANQRAILLYNCPDPHYFDTAFVEKFLTYFKYLVKVCSERVDLNAMICCIICCTDGLLRVGAG